MLCENTREQAEEQLELWRKAIENKGMGVSRSKTEYLPPSSCHDSKVKLGGEEINNVTTFKKIWSMFDADGGSMLMTLFSQMSRIIEKSLEHKLPLNNVLIFHPSNRGTCGDSH